MTDNLRDRIAAVIEDALTTGEVSASGYGREFVRLDGDDIVTLDGTFNLTALAGAVIRELNREFIDFALWLSEEMRGVPLTRVDAESCLDDWKGG